MLANTQSTWPPTTSIGGQPPPDCQGGSRGLVRWRGVTLAPILPRPELPVQRVPVGERKLVTLLGCTLAQTGALRARVGLDAHPVHPDPAGGPRYGGTIHHVATTRLLAIFGAPV